MEVGGEQGVGQPCDLGGLAGGSTNTTLVRFSVNIPVVPPTLSAPQSFSKSQALLPHLLPQHGASDQA